MSVKDESFVPWASGGGEWTKGRARVQAQAAARLDGARVAVAPEGARPDAGRARTVGGAGRLGFRRTRRNLPASCPNSLANAASPRRGAERVRSSRRLDILAIARRKSVSAGVGEPGLYFRISCRATDLLTV